MKVLNFMEAINSGKEFVEYEISPINILNKHKVKWKMDGRTFKRFPPSGNHWFNDGGEFVHELINKSFIYVKSEKLITECQLDNAFFNARKRHANNNLSEHYIKDELGF